MNIPIRQFICIKIIDTFSRGHSNHFILQLHFILDINLILYHSPSQIKFYVAQDTTFMSSWRKIKELTIYLKHHKENKKNLKCQDSFKAGRDVTLGCLLHFPKLYNNVFLFVGLTTLGTFIKF